MRAIVAAIALLLHAACATSSSVVCGNVTCPAGTSCGPNNECIPADCGDGIVSGLETCDGAPAETCTDRGFYGGEATCSLVCQIDDTTCIGSCGDHLVNGPETCDGIPPPGYSCADFGFDVGPLACSSACTPGFQSCSTIGWQGAAGGATNELTAIVATGPRSGFAVGFGGTILRATDGLWLPMASPTTAHLHDLAGDGNGRLIAVGAQGTILVFDGTTWTTVPSPTTSDLLAVTGTSPQNVIAVGRGGTVIRFDGSTWTAATPPTSEDLHDVWIGPQGVFVVGADRTFLKFQSGTWTPITLTTANLPITLRSVFGLGGDVWVAGDVSTVQRGDGTTFQAVPLPSGFPMGRSFDAIWGSNASDVFVAGAEGLMVRWDGTSLEAVSSSTTRQIFDVHGISPSRAFAVTRGGEVLEYNGTALRVQRLSQNGVRALHAFGSVLLAATLPAVVWEFGTPLASDQRGLPGALLPTSLWAAEGTNIFVGTTAGVYAAPQGTTDAYTQVAPRGVNALWGVTEPALRVVAVGDRVQHLVNGTWSEDTTAINGATTLRGVWGSSDGTWFAVGDDGFVMQRTNASAWARLDAAGVTDVLLDVWGTAADDVFAVGTKGTILHWNGTRWRRMYSGTGENLTSVAGSSHSDVFAVGTSGVRLHFDGISWSRMTDASFDLNAVSGSASEMIFGGGAPAGGEGFIERFTRALEDTEERCQDRWDNDGNGLTNCADPACRGEQTCVVGGACPTLERVTCETVALAGSTYSGIARIDDLPCLAHSTPGPEASHRFIAEMSGPVTVTVIDPSGVLDLAVLPAIAGACDVSTCTAATRDGDTLTVTFDATAERVYHILVDGPLYQAEPFTLDVTCN